MESSPEADISLGLSVPTFKTDQSSRKAANGSEEDHDDDFELLDCDMLDAKSPAGSSSQANPEEACMDDVPDDAGHYETVD